jgi:hypothetical protein
MYWGLTQTQNLRLAASRDGREWWFPDRRPTLDNAPLGEYGGGMIWQSKNLVAEGGWFYVYYGGMEGLHSPVPDDAEGNPIEGFTRADGAKLSGDHDGHLVQWSGGEIMPDQAAKVKFYLRRALLYGFESSIDGKAHELR